MRITFVEFSPSGGLFQFTFQLADHLARQGHQVELLTGPRPELRSTTPGFVVTSSLPTWHNGAAVLETRLWHRLRRPFRAVRHVLALGVVSGYVLRRRPDVVFWQPIRFSIDAWAILLTARLSSSTMMSTLLHEPEPLNEQPGGDASIHRTSPLLGRSLAAAMRRMDVVFALSESIRDYVRKTWGSKAPVAVIPHGDEGIFPGREDVVPAEDTPPHVLFFGTWTHYKGIDVLLSAFAQVREQVPEARLTLAGAVGNADFHQIRDRAERVGGVTLRPGYVPMPEVAELMNAHRVIAAPYLRANQSGVVHLGQTFARPVVASKVGEIPQTVDHGETGLLVHPGDVEGLADALVEILRSPQEAGRMGRAAAQRVQSAGAWDRIADVVTATLTKQG